MVWTEGAVAVSSYFIQKPQLTVLLLGYGSVVRYLYYFRGVRYSPRHILPQALQGTDHHSIDHGSCRHQQVGARDLMQEHRDYVSRT